MKVEPSPGALVTPMRPAVRLPTIRWTIQRPSPSPA